MGIPKRDLSREVLFLSDRTLVFRQGDSGSATIIHSPPPDDLAAVLAAVDGSRSIAEICEHLRDAYDGDDVVAILEALRGVILEREDAEPEVAVPNGLTLIGSGALARELAAHFATRTRGVRLLWTGAAVQPGVEGVEEVRVTASERATALAGLPWVIAVHGDGTLGDAFELTRAALQAGTPCIHVLSNRESITVGPTTIPYRTACFECGRIFHYFEQQRADDAAKAMARIEVSAIQTPALVPPLVASAAQLIATELQGLRDGRPFPRMLQSMFDVSLRAGTREVEILPSTQCESCHGANPRPITRGLATLPELRPLDRSRAIEDRAGGVRSVGPEEARRRIQHATRALGLTVDVAGYSARLRARYPELANIPFVEAKVEREFRVDAPTFFARLVPAYGKGISVEQAQCSGMFELLERQLAIYGGGVELVRATWRAVRDHAIDMELFTDGYLDAPDRGARVRFHPDIELDWCWARCLETGRPLLVPAETVFNSGFRDRRRPTCRFRGSHIEMQRRGSSGAAAGCTREDAVLQGLYEVLENDARNLQNRAGYPVPTIRIDTIDDPLITPLLQHVASAGFDLVLRYLSRDIAIPVVEAYITSKRDLTFHRVPGYGCHHDTAIAIRRAITEAIHTLGAAEATHKQTLSSCIYSVFNAFHDTQYCLGRIAGELAFADLPRPDPSWTKISDYIDSAVAIVKRALPRAQLCFVDFPMAGLTDVAVVGVLINGAYDGSFHAELIPERLAKASELSHIFLGELKT